MNEIEKLLGDITKDPKTINLLTRYYEHYTNIKPLEMSDSVFTDIMATSLHILSKLNPEDVELTHDAIEKTSFVADSTDFSDMSPIVKEGYIVNTVIKTMVNELVGKKIRINLLIEKVALLNKNIFGKIVVYSRLEFI
jgi:hypothetical protein